MLRRLFPPGNPPEPNDFVNFADGSDRPLVATYKRWKEIDEIPRADRERLVRLRAPLYDLKVKVLDVLGRAARLRSAEGLWERCFAMVADTMTADDVEFCLRIDRIYEGYDIRTGETVDPDAGLIAGGLTKLLEVIGHYEAEITIGSLCRCKDILEESGLAGLDELGRPALRTSNGDQAYDYFDFVDDPKRSVVEDVVAEYLRLSELEDAFWKEYVARVNHAFENDLYEEVSIRKKIRRRLAHKFQPHVSGYADLVAAQLELTGEVPKPAAAASASLPRNPEQLAGWKTSQAIGRHYGLDPKQMEALRKRLKRGHRLKTSSRLEIGDYKDCRMVHGNVWEYHVTRPRVRKIIDKFLKDQQKA